MGRKKRKLGWPGGVARVNWGAFRGFLPGLRRRGCYKARITMDDSDLLRRYVEDRSEEAFASLVRRHLSLVYGVARRKVAGDRHLAEDVTQQVFTDLARKARALMDRAA